MLVQGSSPLVASEDSLSARAAQPGRLSVNKIPKYSHPLLGCDADVRSSADSHSKMVAHRPWAVGWIPKILLCARVFPCFVRCRAYGSAWHGLCKVAPIALRGCYVRTRQSTPIAPKPIKGQK